MSAPDSYGRSAQSAIYRDGVTGRMPRVPVGWTDLERAAGKRMSREAFAYVAGSAGLERTASANARAFDEWQIVPRVLRDVAARDLSIDLLGKRRANPFLIAPIGVLDLAHAGADTAVARAAASVDVPMVISNQASTSMEQIAAASTAARWFQLYWSSSDDLVASLVGRAEASGCEAIVVTLDTHLLGWRPRDLGLGYLPFSRGRGIAQYTSDPVFTELVRQRAALAETGDRPRITRQTLRSFGEISRNYPGSLRANLRSPLPRAAVETFLDVFSRPSLTWENLSFLREHTRLPIILKGVLHPDDATRAIDAGMDGVWVSNHGGRQIDGEISSLQALPAVAEAVAGKVPVIFDSGIRGGADAFTALALGATAVGVGRPYVYGLALAGASGVAEVMRNLIAELDITMGLAGVTSIPGITRDALAQRAP
jgi:lactate 2-monooxygenase